jgi:adenylyltransferase/sulfurtransferase
MQFREFAFQRRTDCAVCGDRPTITEPRDPPQACDAEFAGRIRRLHADELQALLGGEADLTLVDVREPREFASGHIAGAVNIPVAELQHRLREIRADATPVFICRSGARSITACGIALRAGSPEVCHLEGGMLAWRG